MNNDVNERNEAVLPPSDLRSYKEDVFDRMPTPSGISLLKVLSVTELLLALLQTSIGVVTGLWAMAASGLRSFSLSAFDTAHATKGRKKALTLLLFLLPVISSVGTLLVFYNSLMRIVDVYNIITIPLWLFPVSIVFLLARIALCVFTKDSVGIGAFFTFFRILGESRAEMIFSAGVALSVVMNYVYGLWYLEPIIALVSSLYVVKQAASAFKSIAGESKNRLPDGELERIFAHVASHPEIARADVSLSTFFAGRYNVTVLYKTKTPLPRKSRGAVESAITPLIYKDLKKVRSLRFIYVNTI